MNMSIFEIIKLGQKYMKLWPNKVVLVNYFAEYRAVQISRFVCRYFPVIAIVTFILQLYMGASVILPQALVYAIFILSMPVQALIMLGVKADKFLPPTLASWYKEGVARVNESGGDIKLSLQKPRYFDLAHLLNLTYSKIA